MEPFFRRKYFEFSIHQYTLQKNLWTFLRNLPIFLHSPSLFLGKGSVSSSATPCTVLSPIATRFRGHAPAHHALSEFEIFAFTSTPNSLYSCGLWVNTRPHLTLHREGKNPLAFTLNGLFVSFLPLSGEEVKAKNEKRRTRALRVRVGAFRRTKRGAGHTAVNAVAEPTNFRGNEWSGSAKISLKSGIIVSYFLYLL